MNGRRFAYAGVCLGLAVSVWANIADAMVKPETLPARWPAGKAWHADPGAIGTAAFWPLALFLALEVLSRTSWGTGRGLLVARAGVGLVAVVAAVVSYLHLHGLLGDVYGQPAVPALIGPLAIDGLMAVSAAALLAGGHPPTEQGGELEVQADAPTEAPVRVVAAARIPRQEATVPVLDRARAAIAAGDLPAAPSGNALRKHLGIGATRAGRLAVELSEGGASVG